MREKSNWSCEDIELMQSKLMSGGGDPAIPGCVLKHDRLTLVLQKTFFLGLVAAGVYRAAGVCRGLEV